MAAVADACMGELMKIRANVTTRLKSHKMDVSTDVKGSIEVKQETYASFTTSTDFRSPGKGRSDEAMPEAVVSLLMDRFAPC